MMLSWRRSTHFRRLILLLFLGVCFRLRSIEKSEKFEWAKWKSLEQSRSQNVTASRNHSCKSPASPSLETLSSIPTWQPEWLSWTLARFPHRLPFFPVNKTLFVVEADQDMKNLRPYMMCTAESAARANPELRVAVVTASQEAQQNAPIFLTWIPNLVVVHVELESYFMSGPLAPLYRRFSVLSQQNSSTRSSRLSKLNRALGYLLLKDHGGVYSQPDVVWMNRAPEKGFVVPQNPHFIKDSTFGLYKDHPLLDYIFDKLRMYGEEEDVWDRDEAWDAELLTEAVKPFCHFNRTFLNVNCTHDIQVLHVSGAVPFDTDRTYLLYKSDYYPWVYKRATNTLAIAFHYLSSKKGLIKGRMGVADQQCVSRLAPLFKLMQHRCPLTLNHVFDKFLGSYWNDPRL